VVSPNAFIWEYFWRRCKTWIFERTEFQAALSFNDIWSRLLTFVELCFGSRVRGTFHMLLSPPLFAHYPSCKQRLTNRVERDPRRARWKARIGLNLSCWLAFTLFSFRDHAYLLRLTRGFTWELNYTQFLTFESTRNSPALQLLGSHYPRDPKKLQSAKCPSNVVRTKFPTWLHKAPDWFLLDSWEFLERTRSLV
jgi:hypothetical protein